MNDLNITRLTAAKYLEQLVDIGLLHKEKIGRSNYYINQELVALFIESKKESLKGIKGIGY